MARDERKKLPVGYHTLSQYEKENSIGLSVFIKSR